MSCKPYVDTVAVKCDLAQFPYFQGTPNHLSTSIAIIHKSSVLTVFVLEHVAVTTTCVFFVKITLQSKQRVDDAVYGTLKSASTVKFPEKCICFYLFFN